MPTPDPEVPGHIGEFTWAAYRGCARNGRDDECDVSDFKFFNRLNIDENRAVCGCFKERK